MEQPFQSLTTQKIRELFAVCEVGDCSHEPIRQQILDISNFVHKARLAAGKKNVPPCVAQGNGLATQTTTDELRGSYRLKRDRINYAGLDESSGTKRTRGKTCKTSSKAAGTAAVGGQPNGYTAIQDQLAVEDRTNGEVVAHGISDQVAALGSVPSDADSALFSLFIRSPSASEACSPRDVITESEAARRADVDLSAELSGDAARDNLLRSLAPPSSHLLNPTGTMEVMQKILLNCAQLSYARGKCNDKDKMVNVKAEIEEIRSHAEQIAGLKYVEAVNAVKQEHSIGASRAIQARYNETFFWEIITQGAKLLDSAKLPPPKGPPDEFSKAEKVATERFMVETGHGTSYTTQQRCRRLWKSLSEMRKAGVDKILFYRTTKFNRFCESYPKDKEESLIDTVLSWEQVYGPHLVQLERRVAEESEGDLTGRSWLNQPYVAERLKFPGTWWDRAENSWISGVEKVAFESSSGFEEISAEQFGGLFDTHSAGNGNRCKSTFVSLLPRGEKSLSVCPIVTAEEGELLGVFAGKIRYSDWFDATYGIRGPKKNLWLDYSQVMGVLNLMRVSPPDGYANVRLQWEVVHDLKGDPAWRVSVRAVKTIKPFEELVRAAPQTEQHDMHQAYSENARTGDDGNCS